MTDRRVRENLDSFVDAKLLQPFGDVMVLPVDQSVVAFHDGHSAAQST